MADSSETFGGGKRRVSLLTGYHSPEVLDRVRRAWDGDDLLVLCPPRLEDRSFVEYLVHASFPSEPVFGLFTTGTSGRRKLVLYSRENVRAALDGVLSFFDERRIDSVFCYPQPFHTFGLCLGYLLCQLKGYRLLTPEGKYSSASHERRAQVRDAGCLTLGTPTHFRDLIAFTETRDVRLAPTYSAIVGGAPVPVSLWRDLREKLSIAEPSVGYGATEACPGVTHLPPGLEPREDAEVGFPLPGLEVKLTPEGISARGRSTCLAIWDGTKLAIPREIALRDELRLRDDGAFVFVRRNELVLNRGGEKFSLEAIEAELASRLGLEAVAVAVSDERLGEELGLVVASRNEAAGLEEKLRGELEAAFGRRFLSAILHFTEQLPLNENGKPDRKLCTEWCTRKKRFPIRTGDLSAWMPHRAPMVWISEVLWADGDAGECRADVSPPLVSGTDGVRPSSYLEWMAQAYGFVRAARLFETGAAPDGPSRAFLASITGFEVSEAPPKGELTIRVRKKCELGPLSLVEGEVRNGRGEWLARAQLKLYATEA